MGIVRTRKLFIIFCGGPRQPQLTEWRKMRISYTNCQMNAKKWHLKNINISSVSFWIYLCVLPWRSVPGYGADFGCGGTGKVDCILTPRFLLLWVLPRVLTNVGLADIFFVRTGFLLYNIKFHTSFLCVCVCLRSLRQQLKCHSDQTNGRATKRDRWMLG